MVTGLFVCNKNIEIEYMKIHYVLLIHCLSQKKKDYILKFTVKGASPKDP